MKKGRYRHYKGRDYIVIGVARHSETDEDWSSISRTTGNAACGCGR